MLENKYHFEFPQLYETLLKDRMFDYTAPQYLLDYKFYGADLEPFSFEESLQNYEDFPFWDKDPAKQIFPCAQSGGGDWYGFCFSMKDGASLPIVLMSHDSDDALVLADNLEDFIFYKMLMASLKVDDECDDETFKAELQRVLSTHKKYLKNEYIKVLEQLYVGPIAKFSDCGLEKVYALEEIYVKETAFTRFNEEIYCGI